MESIKVVWEVEVLTKTKTTKPEIVTRKIVTYYTPPLEKEDTAMEKIRYQLSRSEKIHLILSKDKQTV